MEGKLLEATNEKVVVERNGRPVTIALNLLSKEDQEFVKELVVQFEKEGVEFRFTVFPDVGHNGIHWKLAKEPKVWEWLIEQQKS